MILDTFRKMMEMLSPRERRKAWILIIFMVIVGIVETGGIASVLPFIAVLSDPSRIEQSEKLSWLYNIFGFQDVNNFMIFLGFATFGVVMFGVVSRIALVYWITRFSNLQAFSISSRLLRGYLHQPYTWFLNRHSSDLSKTVLAEVDTIINGTFVPAMRMIAALALVMTVAALLLFLQPVVALATSVILGGCYGAILVLSRKYLTKYGQMRFVANAERFRVANEATGGVKDVKLMGLEDGYVSRFRQPARRMALANTGRSVVGEAPRYLLQGVAFGGMLLMILLLLITENAQSLDTIVPILAVYAFAGLKMLPALQQVFSQLTSIRFTRPTFLAVHKDLLNVDVRTRAMQVQFIREQALPLTRDIVLQDVHYAYPAADRAALKGLSLRIPARTTVGIVGGTGAGKTTAVDLILGLLEPQSGQLLIDGVTITEENMQAWQNSIGYVPQQIFLTDDTVASNIAFGLPADKIDMKAVERAAKVAELHDFVVSEMPQGYQTLVGERGVRLSGGQRQRIGIARALYYDPDVLIMDEATSALDNVTERVVMDAVHNLGEAKTIVLIAHRLSTVRECDTIFMLEQGQLLTQGSYDELLETNDTFRTLAAGER